MAPAMDLLRRNDLGDRSGEHDISGCYERECDTIEMVGDLGIEPSVRLREGVTVPCHTLRPVAH